MLTGAGPWQILAAFMALTMLVANVLNNTAGDIFRVKETEGRNRAV